MIFRGFKLSDYANGMGGYDSPTGQGFDGVVEIYFDGIGIMTGSLLYGGKAILTAAHVFKNSDFTTGNVVFATKSVVKTTPIKAITAHPDYNKSTNNNDVAIVWLDDSAQVPVDAERYDIYKGDTAPLISFRMAGYGMIGNGETAAVTNDSHLRLTAKNKFDAVGDYHSKLFNNDLGTQLLYDFDGNDDNTDALGNMSEYGYGCSGATFGIKEGHAWLGDSGSGAFSNDDKMTLVGTSTYVMSSDFDIDPFSNGTLGEIGAYTNMAYYHQWVDQTIRASYVDVPKSANEVKNTAIERDSGTSHAYFYVERTSSSTAPITFSYATKDGTAKAGSDYIEQSGVFKLYQGEASGIIAIEIIGDKIKEGSESFSLELAATPHDDFKVYGGDHASHGARISLDASGKTIESVNIIGQVIVDNDFY